MSAGLGERQVTEFVQYDQVDPDQGVDQASGLIGIGLGLEFVDQVDDVEESGLGAVADTGAGDGDSEVGFPGAGATDEDRVALTREEGPGC